MLLEYTTTIMKQLGHAAHSSNLASLVVYGCMSGFGTVPLNRCPGPWRWSPWAAPARPSRPPGRGRGCAAWTSRSWRGIRGAAAAGSRCARPAGNGRRHRARSPGEPAPPDCNWPGQRRSWSRRQLGGNTAAVVSACGDRARVTYTWHQNTPKLF